MHKNRSLNRRPRHTERILGWHQAPFEYKNGSQKQGLSAHIRHGQFPKYTRPYPYKHMKMNDIFLVLNLLSHKVTMKCGQITPNTGTRPCIVYTVSLLYPELDFIHFLKEHLHPNNKTCFCVTVSHDGIYSTWIDE